MYSAATGALTTVAPVPPPGNGKQGIASQQNMKGNHMRKEKE